MKTRLIPVKFVLFGFLVTASLGTYGQPGDQRKMTPVTDTGFTSKNIGDNMVEIRLAEIARDNSTHDSVVAIARVLITDHSAIMNDLVAAGKELRLPKVDTTTLALPRADDTPREVFDRTWVTQMLAKHKMKLKELEAAIPQLKNKRVKAAAQSALPKIRLHIEMLTSVAPLVGANTSQ